MTRVELKVPPAPRGTPRIEVTFAINADGILSVTAEDKATTHHRKIAVQKEKWHLSKQDIDLIISRAARYKVRLDINTA